MSFELTTQRATLINKTAPHGGAAVAGASRAEHVVTALDRFVAAVTRQ